MYPIVASLVRDTGGLPATSEEEKTYARTKGDEHWTTKNEDETSNASTKLD